MLTGFQTQKEQDRQQCNGMYSKSAWGGDVDPFILTKFIKTTPEGDEDPLVSLVVFEWRDEDLVGRWPNDDAPKVSTLPAIKKIGTDTLLSAESIHMRRWRRQRPVLRLSTDWGVRLKSKRVRSSQESGPHQIGPPQRPRAIELPGDEDRILLRWYFRLLCNRI